MAFSTQAIKYGWVALASLGVLTGVTIYVANNQRHQVKPEDIIQPVLGTVERCLALQYSTNPVSYYVAPPSFVRTWLKTNVTAYALTNPFAPADAFVMVLCYTSYWPSTTGVPVVNCYTSSFDQYGGYYYPYLKINYAESWTATGGHVWVTRNVGQTVNAGFSNYFEIVTNTIGWHIDRDMMVSLDATIKALVPYYCDTNTVYDGTTNIVMLTVTGLWASLKIGDGTNKFTREPAWTNSVITNWIVNYTSYWPSTSGVTTNINYTSDYRQVVNYAQSWTATGGHVWASASNWSSVAVTITNQATYGDYPWQIYAEDLQERYKVLNALKKILRTGIYTGRRKGCAHTYTDGWAEEKDALEDAYLNGSGYGLYINSTGLLDRVIIMAAGYVCYEYPPQQDDLRYFGGNIEGTQIREAYLSQMITTSVEHKISHFYKCYSNSFTKSGWGSDGFVTQEFDANGTGFQFSNWYLLVEENEFNFNPTGKIDCAIGVDDNYLPAWCDAPAYAEGTMRLGNTGYQDWWKSRGIDIEISSGLKAIIDFNFQYCTNRYW
jgi:hypothetical protein